MTRVAYKLNIAAAYNYITLYLTVNFLLQFPLFSPSYRNLFPSIQVQTDFQFVCHECHSWNLWAEFIPLKGDTQSVLLLCIKSHISSTILSLIESERICPETVYTIGAEEEKM